MARGHELAEAGAGGVPPEAGRGRRGGARRSGRHRGPPAAGAAARLAPGAAGGAGRAGRSRLRRCCSRASCCGCRPTCAGSRRARGTGTARRQITKLPIERVMTERAPGPRAPAGCARSTAAARRLVRAVDDVEPRGRAGRDGGGDGSERVRQVDAAVPARRARAPDGRRDRAGRRSRSTTLPEAGLARLRRHARRVRVPGVPPGRRADRARERRAAGAAGRRLAAQPRASEPASCWSRSGSATAPSISLRALRRPAPAGRDRPRAGQ